MSNQFQSEAAQIASYQQQALAAKAEAKRYQEAWTKAQAETKTLRDEFAMMALNALIQFDTLETIKRITELGHDPIKTQAETAYKFANAMIQARKETR